MAITEETAKKIVTLLKPEFPNDTFVFDESGEPQLVIVIKDRNLSYTDLSEIIQVRNGLKINLSVISVNRGFNVIFY